MDKSRSQSQFVSHQTHVSSAAVLNISFFVVDIRVAK